MAHLKLDLLFVVDVTASQGPYIQSATRSVVTICNKILNSDKVRSPEDLRFGLISFRDHPPQDFTFVTRQWNFTSDIQEMLHNLKSLPPPRGGGDPPEAITAALAKALNMGWRSDCSKIIVLISDAPPHGIGSGGDGFPDGVPNDQDPLVLAREMAMKGIILHFVACEPTLSTHKNATEFYCGLTRITSGIVMPLIEAESLAQCIIGSALESLALEQLIQELEPILYQLIDEQQQPPPVVVAYLYQQLSLKSQTITQIHVESIYNWNRERIENVHIWTKAPDITAAKSQLNEIQGNPFHTRIDRWFNPYKYVKITLKNSSDLHIKITWFDQDGNVKFDTDDQVPALDISIPPNSVIDKWMEVHETQTFRLQQGRRMREVERCFTRHTAFDLAIALE